MKRQLSPVLLVAQLLVPTAFVAGQAVYVVSPEAGPGVDFTSLQAAVDAAADGDVLLVTAGEHDNLVEIVDKSLVVAGVKGPSGSVPDIGRLAVLDLSAGKSVMVRGLRLDSSPDTLIFEVSGCEGAVLVENCTVDAGQVFFDQTPQSVIVASSHVVLTRCSLQGAGSAGGQIGTPGGPGLVVDAATVALYDCEVTGGAGFNATFIGEILLTSATGGGQGLQHWSGTVFVSGSEIRGGKGGAGSQSTSGALCSQPKNGGAGVRTYGLLQQLDTVIAGGAPGFAPACSTPANAGTDLIVLPGGSVDTIPELARRLEISSPLENGGLGTVSVQGQPGDNIVLLQSLAPLGVIHAGLKGALAGQPPWLVIPLGTLGPAGALAFEVHLPSDALPVGLPSLKLIHQFVTGADSGGGLLSSPTALVLVEDVP